MKRSFLNILRIPLFVVALGIAEAGIDAANVKCDGICCTRPTDDAAVNHAYLASPRGREEFPALARTRPEAEARTPKVLREPNRALANSPRFREEHPALHRSSRRATVKVADDVPSDVIKNSALAASPRVREEFPALRIIGSASTAERSNVCLCAGVVQ
jgi:hypothetical protein